MSEVPAGAFAYMTFRHSVTGIVRTSWTVTVLKNGRRDNTINVGLVEEPSGTYNFFFRASGDHNDHYTLVVYPTSTPSVSYAESWLIKRPFVESGVSLLAASLPQIEQSLSRIPYIEQKLNRR